jgi:uroporphyrinogen decarboxylase
MTHLERIFTALDGKYPDQVPLALWRHFPVVDQTADGLARATLGFQKQWGFDLVKVTPVAGFMAEAWGAQLVPKNNEEGTRDYLSRVIKSEKDWLSLKQLDVTQGVLGRELRALHLIRQGIQTDTPLVQTVFSPLGTARNLAGDRYLEDLRSSPKTLHAALDIITRVTIAFARQNLEIGADGVFFAVQLASHEILTEAEYREFGVAYDRRVLDALKDHAQLTMLHIHGMKIMFDLLRDYPVQIVNWHDRRTAPSLAEAQKRFKGIVAGGLNEWEVLQRGTPEEVRAQVKDAFDQTKGLRMVIAPGCVVPIDTPEENIRAVTRAVREFS